MSTRSFIGYSTKDGSIKYIYCHCDGYPSWVGKILENFYTTVESVEKLINLGDLSRLGTTPESGGWGTIAENLLTDTIGKNLTPDESVIFPKYCRDYKSRGDSNVEARTCDTESEFELSPMIAHGYLFIDNVWYHYSRCYANNSHGFEQKKELVSEVLKHLKED